MITKEVLEDLYYNHKLSQKDIAIELSVSRPYISKLFKKFNIKSRSISEATKLKSDVISQAARVSNNKKSKDSKIKNASWYNINFFNNHYIEQRKTFKQIAEEVGVSKSSVERAAHELGVRVRSNSEAHRRPYDWNTRENLIDLYDKQDLSIRQIGHIYNVSDDTIRKKLIAHGIPLRGYKNCCKSKPQKEPKPRVIDRFPWRNWSFFEEYYIKGDKSFREIAKMVGKTAPIVRGVAKELGIPKRSKEKISKLLSENSKKNWKNLDYRIKRGESARLSRTKVPKSTQGILYSMLDDLNIKYYRQYNNKPSDPEVWIDGWELDCVIPRNGSRDLIIECNSDYWHGDKHPKQQERDARKALHLHNNWSHLYELKYLWEHEFAAYNKVLEKLKYWLDITQVSLEEFSFEDVEIKYSCAKEYKPLLGKYHYLLNAGRGGKAIGAYLEDELIAICVFSPPSRQNLAAQFKLQSNQVRDLSRFCINPKYQKKNFGSWLISRAIARLKRDRPQTKLIIAYSDTTYNHNGILYKACNFKLDGKVRPDYWYETTDHLIMHKRTLYDMACKMSLSEKEYALMIGANRVYGKEKLRYLYWLDKKAKKKYVNSNLP